MHQFKCYGIALITLTLLFNYGCSSENAPEALAPSPADAVWIDVRSSEEYASGHVDEASNIDHDAIVAGVAAKGLAKDTPIYLYCGSGHRAGLAKDALETQHYTNVVNVGSLKDARNLLKGPG
ncbi:MAG: phage shock protein E [Halioglobus sp.]|jgi:phage shock protein E